MGSILAMTSKNYFPVDILQSTFCNLVQACSSRIYGHHQFWCWMVCKQLQSCKSQGDPCHIIMNLKQCCTHSCLFTSALASQQLQGLEMLLMRMRQGSTAGLP